ncbi:Tetracycline efflux protein TetA [Rubellimicrobium mesophilum DSM 19309]|uniref:Tetracycline efflux protein TetA n=1 Tax=Rubellimicrobium mesophilum DSM 19309 TaxID=442562 RepID=A0A017HAT0_9RHOB|nr:tetracycline resistance MFS efflux pump [Rubellimicrobium mesophilum]EYD71572.1 Tetracycline efflux protein TetA [Rubellimicrobium mesophilum DSM 19309]
MRSPLPFLLATLFLDAVGIGLVAPVMPDLIAGVEGGDIGDVALWGGLLTTAYALMQFLGAPALGALSDRVGRRPVLLGSLAVMAADYAGSALAGSIWTLLGLRLLAGASAATIATCNAALADVTPPEGRARAFGLLSAAFLLGFVLGPVVSGVLGEIGPRAPFWAAAALAALNMAFGALTLPETVPPGRRRPLSLARANPFGAARAVARLGGAARLLLVILLHDLGIVAYVAVWAYWGKAAFGWSPLLIGVSLAAYGLGGAVVQGWLMPFYLRWFGERGTILWGLVADAAFLLAFALLPPTPLGGLIAILLCPFSALPEATLPAIQGRLSRLAPADAQGEALGVAAAARSLAAVLGPLAMTTAFAWGAEQAPPFFGVAYLVGAALMLGAVVAFLGDRTPDPAPAPASAT